MSDLRGASARLLPSGDETRSSVRCHPLGGSPLRSPPGGRPRHTRGHCRPLCQSVCYVKNLSSWNLWRGSGHTEVRPRAVSGPPAPPDLERRAKSGPMGSVHLGITARVSAVELRAAPTTRPHRPPGRDAPRMPPGSDLGLGGAMPIAGGGGSAPAVPGPTVQGVMSL